jgi:mono/diheme cytochrome c family protein
MFLLSFMACDRSQTNQDGENKATASKKKQGGSKSQKTDASTDTRNQSRAEANYQRYCASCHGETGQGNGPAAEYLYPKPRNLVTAPYKFTSTPGGQPPADRDLHRTISEGLAGTGMPGFGSLLSDNEIDGLVEYVKELSPRFEQLSEPEPISIPQPPEPTDKLISKGKNLYQKNACWTCHGRDGEGDGPSAEGLKNDRGNPIQPRDFTTGVYKSGGEPKDLYRTIVNGLPGTGMPAYRSALKKEKDRWALVYYLRSLSDRDGETERPRFNGKRVLTVAESKLPGSPSDPAWNDVEGVELGTYPLWKRPEPAPLLTVKAVHNGNKAAFLLAWNDATNNTQDLKQTSFTDAAAIQLPSDTADQPPFHGMGDLMDDGKVRIWHWKAIRARGNRQGEPVDLDDVYQNMYADRYRGLSDAGTRDGKQTPPADVNIQDQPSDLQSAVDADNPLASKKLAGRSVLEYVAEGFGSLTAVPPEQHRTTGQSSWSKGTWRVVIERPLSTDLKNDPSLAPGTSTWIGFAVFDGHFNERNGKKSVTQWIRLNVEK